MLEIYDTVEDWTMKRHKGHSSGQRTKHMNI